MIDLVTHQGSLRAPRRSTAHAPGSAAKIAAMRDRLFPKRGNPRHLHEADDQPADSLDMVRVPILHPKNHKIIGWKLVPEREYRQTEPHLDWWGVEAAEDD